MAQATISITITDTPQVTLLDFRDTVALTYGVVGASTNQQKLDAIKAGIVVFLKERYQSGKNVVAAASVAGLSNQSDLS